MSEENPNKISWLLSWPVIILALVFWPLAALLFFLRLRKDRKLAFFVGKSTQILGNCAGIFFLICAVAYFFTAEGTAGDRFGGAIVMTIFLALPFFIMGKIGKGIVVRGNRIKAYLDLIVNQHILSIPDIAAKIKRTELQVVKDIEKMGKRGFFRGLVIDTAHKRLRVPAVEAQLQYEAMLAREGQMAASPIPVPVAVASAPGSVAAAEAMPSAPAAVSQPVQESQRPQTKSCKCCGANNLIWPGREPVCEFCGSIV